MYMKHAFKMLCSLQSHQRDVQTRLAIPHHVARLHFSLSI